MTVLSFDKTGVDVVYEGTEFRMDKALIEEATQKSYREVTDHEVLRLIEDSPDLSGQATQIDHILSSD